MCVCVCVPITILAFGIGRYKFKGMLAPSQHLMMVIDACKGIQHLHAHKIIHRDIAARNMLLQVI